MPELAWVDASDRLTDEELLDQIAKGAYEAGRPYFDYLFGDPGTALAALGAWVRRPSSEVYAGRARLLVEGGTPVAGYIALTGAECRACRVADGLALMGLVSGADRAALLGRIGQTRGLFAALA